VGRGSNILDRHVTGAVGLRVRGFCQRHCQIILSGFEAVRGDI
jgi:hypothetical protein